MARQYLKPGVNDLYTFCIENNRQDLLEEFDCEKNYPLTPHNIARASRYKIWWKHICEDGSVHEWKAYINNRTSRGDRCPYCSNKKLLVGFNDLKTWCISNKREDLLKEWDYAENSKLDITPDDIMYGYTKKVHWECEKGHKWETSVTLRTGKGTNCPICCRQQTSFAEQLIYLWLKQFYDDTENRSKLDGFEYDIYIPSLEVAIEYDGMAWHDKKSIVKRDKQKYEKALELGIKLITIKEDQSTNTYRHENNIYYRYNRRYDNYMDFIIEIAGYFKEKFNIELNTDTSERMLQEAKARSSKVLEENTVAEVCPELIEEWHPTKNGKLKPTNVSARGDERIWWKCKTCEYEWSTCVGQRVRTKSGCPVCAGQAARPGIDSMDITHPFLLTNWDYNANSKQGLDPHYLLATSGRRAYWKCYKCEHKWTHKINNVTRSMQRCPKCNIPFIETDFKKEYSINETIDFKEKIEYVKIYESKYYNITDYSGVLSALINEIYYRDKSKLKAITDTEAFELNGNTSKTCTDSYGNTAKFNRITTNSIKCRKPKYTGVEDIYIDVFGMSYDHIETICKVLNICDLPGDTVKIKFKETHKQEPISQLEALGYTQEEIANLGEISLEDIL